MPSLAAGADTTAAHRIGLGARQEEPAESAAGSCFQAVFQGSFKQLRWQGLAIEPSRGPRFRTERFGLAVAWFTRPLMQTFPWDDRKSRSLILALCGPKVNRLSPHGVENVGGRLCIIQRFHRI